MKGTLGYKSQCLIKNGVVKQAVKQGKKEEIRDVEKENLIKQFCLNCTKENCNGDCKDIREFEGRTTRQ